MVVNNDTKRIQYLIIGWPASMYHGRVWTKITIAKNSENHSSPGEYLLADSAFLTIIMYEFLQINQAELQKDQNVFNNALSAA
jgi:hypothetical protein